jgi:hypothetical protein
MMIVGCKSTENPSVTIKPLNESVAAQTTVSDHVQYGRKTISVTAGGITSYDCETGESETASLPISENVILNLYEDMLYVFDDESDTMYTVSPQSLKVEAEAEMNFSDTVILYGAVGKTYYIFFGKQPDAVGFFLVHRETGAVEYVKSNLDVWGMESMAEDKILLCLGAKSSDAVCFSVYHMDDNTFEEQRYYTNSLGVRQIAYNKENNSAVYTIKEGYVYTTYALSLEDGTIETVDIFQDDTTQYHSLATASNLTVLCMDGTTYLYTDMDDDSNCITIATVENKISLMQQEIADQYSIETGVLIKESRYTDKEKFDLALMSGNIDADILYVDEVMMPVDYVRNEAYDDLWNYSAFTSLPEEKTMFLRFAAQTDDGKLIGIPFNVCERDSESTYVAVLMTKYFDEYVDLMKREFYDDGTALRALIEARRAYNNNGKVPPADAEMYTEYRSGFFMLYSDSDKKEEAVSFLAHLHRCMIGDTSLDEYSMVSLYPESIDTARSFVLWKNYNKEMFNIVLSAVEEALEKPETTETKVADVVAKLKMMILE